MDPSIVIRSHSSNKRDWTTKKDLGSNQQIRNSLNFLHTCKGHIHTGQITCVLEAGNRWAWNVLRLLRNNCFKGAFILTLLLRELKWHSTSSVHVGWVWEALESESSAKQFSLSNESRRLPSVRFRPIVAGKDSGPPMWQEHTTNKIIKTATRRDSRRFQTSSHSTIGSLIRHRQSLESDSVWFAHIHKWSSRHALEFFNKNEYAPIEAVYTCTNAEKVPASVPASMASPKPTPTRPFVDWIYLDSVGQITRIADAWFFLFFGRQVVEVCTYRSNVSQKVTSREVQIRFGLACPTNDGNLLFTRFGISHQARNSWQRHLPPLPTFKIQEHPIRMQWSHV